MHDRNVTTYEYVVPKHL